MVVLINKNTVAAIFIYICGVFPIMTLHCMSRPILMLYLIKCEISYDSNEDTSVVDSL